MCVILENAEGSLDIGHYTEVVDRIGSPGSDLIINLTIGEGGRFIPTDDVSRIAAPCSTLYRPKLYVTHVKELKPEICTLDFNTINNRALTTINTPRNLEIMANVINEVGTRPEVEIFGSGDLDQARGG
jgi:uncharacterized protein (DUF849 family)